MLTDPYDLHVHLRQDKLLSDVAPYTARQFSAAVAMPNTKPPIYNLNAARVYERYIKDATSNYDFRPLIPLYFQTHTIYSKETFAVKLYPKGLTTNSNEGVDLDDEKGIFTTLASLEENDIPLCVHGEAPGYYTDREYLFLSYAIRWTREFPKLRIIVEHLSTFEACDIVNAYDNIYGTITPHHMLLTGNDWVGPPFNAHHYCMPVCKTDEDRKALVEMAATSKKVALGTDSAPHRNKLCQPGIFTAPFALQLVAEIFDNDSAIMERFCCKNAHNIYPGWLPTLGKTVTLEKRDFPILYEYSGIIPMWAGKILRYSLC